MKTRQELERIADYWDCMDSETLHHTTIEDALSYVIDGHLNLKQTVAEVEQAIRHGAPVEVDCYAHNQWTDGAIKNYADDVFEALCNRFDEDEDFLDPDEYVEKKLDADQKAAVMAAARALVAEFAKHAKPWCCGVVGTVVIEADEGVQLMREANPTWFDKS